MFSLDLVDFDAKKNCVWVFHPIFIDQTQIRKKKIRYLLENLQKKNMEFPPKQAKFIYLFISFFMT
jgi:hypothetical protein